MMARINPPPFLTVISLKQLTHRLAGGAAHDAAPDALIHLFRAAAGNGLNVADQAGELSEETLCLVNTYS